MKFNMILAIVLIIVPGAYAQNRVIYGNLTAYNSFPVMNVEVTSKKAKATTVSDSLGNFSIVCLEKDVIIVKPKGFQTVNQKVNDETDTVKINLVLVDTKKNRELVVNAGYITKSNLNYAVTQLEEENNDYCKYTDIYTLIRVEGTGVQVSASGQITVQGGSNSFIAGSSSALLMVDGQAQNSIDWIRPCIVKSIHILRGSEATIYGTRGGNGVVVITTKK